MMGKGGAIHPTHARFLTNGHQCAYHSLCMHKLAFKKPVIGGVIGCETEKITQFREGLPDD